ncbi:MAG: DUF4267 domain-containing protein [Hyphomonadaceae bacterium]|nr:DUF4267 domain-containing protein [Hyphomonadaceae bacterium]
MTATPHAQPHPAPAKAFSRAQVTGLVLAWAMALYMAVNTARASLDPVGFAATLGAPLADPADTGFVFVYAFRAAFLALLVGWLALRRDVGTLRFVALAAVVMPLGDAVLTQSLGAPPATVARHGAIIVLLALVWALLGARPRMR